MSSLPVNDTHDLFRVMQVYKYVVIMQIIMPEAWLGDGSILWDKSVDNFFVPC